jgi:hypothetical protein
MEHCIYKLQVNKPITQTKLKKIVKKLLGKSDLKITDKKKYYEIIHMDRKYFKPKSYQKEKHDNVTITVGILKKKHAKLHGAGIKEDEQVRKLINKIHTNYENRYIVGGAINPNVKKGFLDFVHGFLLPFKTIGSIIPEIGLPLQMAAGALDNIIPRGNGLSKRVKVNVV